MKYTSKIEKALKVAARLHLGQKRKSIGEVPYIIHPFAVAIILSSHTDDEDIIAAGLLHDTVEDSEYTPQELERDFGKRVHDIVMGVTETKKDETGEELPWKVRKEEYFKGLWNDSPESLMICAADKIHNMQNQIDDYKEFGPKTLENFNSTPEERIWYHEEVFKVLKERLNNPGLLKDYETLLEETRKIK